MPLIAGTRMWAAVRTPELVKAWQLLFQVSKSQVQRTFVVLNPAIQRPPAQVVCSIFAGMPMILTCMPSELAWPRLPNIIPLIGRQTMNQAGVSVDSRSAA